MEVVFFLAVMLAREMQGGCEAEEIRFFRALINREVFFRRRTSALQRREAALSLIIPAVHPVFLLNKLL